MTLNPNDPFSYQRIVLYQQLSKNKRELAEAHVMAARLGSREMLDRIKVVKKQISETERQLAAL